MTKFLDSDVIVFAFSDNPRKEECRKSIYDEDLIVDTLVLLESYSKIATITKKRELAEGMVNELYRRGNIAIVNFDINLFFEAVKRNKKYNLKISDLIHYTAALLKGCSSIISYDRDFDNLEVKRIEPASS